MEEKQDEHPDAAFADDAPGEKRDDSTPSVAPPRSCATTGWGRTPSMSMGRGPRRAAGMTGRGR